VSPDPTPVLVLWKQLPRHFARITPKELVRDHEGQSKQHRQRHACGISIL